MYIYSARGRVIYASKLLLIGSAAFARGRRMLAATADQRLYGRGDAFLLRGDAMPWACVCLSVCHKSEFY